MRRLIFAIAVLLLPLVFVAPAESASMTCVVNGPISAAQLNAPNDGYWSFDVFNAAPNVSYRVKVNWPGDPSNGAHTNAGIQTDATGHGISAYQRYWSPDGFLPGYFLFHDPYDPMSGFVAVPGDFSVQVGPKISGGTTAGKASCHGTVAE